MCQAFTDPLRCQWKTGLFCAAGQPKFISLRFGRLHDTALRLRIREITVIRVHYGYRRVHVLLKRESWCGIKSAFTGSNVKRGCHFGLNVRAAINPH